MEHRVIGADVDVPLAAASDQAKVGGYRSVFPELGEARAGMHLLVDEPPQKIAPVRRSEGEESACETKDRQFRAYLGSCASDKPLPAIENLAAI